MIYISKDLLLGRLVAAGMATLASKAGATTSGASSVAPASVPVTWSSGLAGSASEVGRPSTKSSLEWQERISRMEGTTSTGLVPTSMVAGRTGSTWIVVVSTWEIFSYTSEVSNTSKCFSLSISMAVGCEVGASTSVGGTPSFTFLAVVS